MTCTGRREGEIVLDVPVRIDPIVDVLEVHPALEHQVRLEIPDPDIEVRCRVRTGSAPVANGAKPQAHRPNSAESDLLIRPAMDVSSDFFVGRCPTYPCCGFQR